MKTQIRILAAISTAALVAALSPGGALPGAAAPAPDEKHWSYETKGDAVGPEGWGALPGNATCSSGTSQSPVALVSAAATPTSQKLAFRYAASPLEIVNNGHTQKVSVAPGSILELDGVSYALTQFHFHAPSEHTLDGKRYPMEMHLVHLGAHGTPALVVGVLIDEGAASGPLEGIFANLPKAKGGTAEPAGITVDPAAILPVTRAFLRYAGSLTTPPCTEGIRWYVLTTPVTASKEQIAAYRATGLDHTNRPLQPVGARILYRSGP